MFEQLKKYIVADESVQSNQSPIFYPLPQGEIEEAEQLLNLKLPKELREFYKEIGYGFLKTDRRTFINRIFDPISLADFRLRQYDYENNPNLEGVDDEESIVFFEVTELSFLTIKFRQENELGQCPIYYGRKKIAESLEEFMNKMESQPDYYI
ncbi:SMI1/KNR4 family protein [Ectobacillus panaciterrae]|uniref:SMI1/KNR4 family protein n=1 Tax=Ectobacillus panaciterrae TaxID=363872 RepID=UPI0004106191|nr:SMI1/KNR4 family protein [Ectobacillus panaciterrae]